MARQGVCTGWLNMNTKAVQCEKTAGKTNTDIENDMAALSIEQKPEVR